MPPRRNKSGGGSARKGTRMKADQAALHMIVTPHARVRMIGQGVRRTYPKMGCSTAHRELDTQRAGTTDLGRMVTTKSILWERCASSI